MIYQFKDRKTYRGIKPQDAGEELERIRMAHEGKLTPARIVKSARRKTSPLHAAFTWDDSKAAHEYRLSEARYLIKQVVVLVTPRSQPQQAYWNVTVTEVGKGDRSVESHYYQSSQVVAASPIEYRSALSVMRRELESAHRGLAELMQLAPQSDRRGISRSREHVLDATKALPIFD